MQKWCRGHHWENRWRENEVIESSIAGKFFVMDGRNRNGVEDIGEGKVNGREGGISYIRVIGRVLEIVGKSVD